jgi:hypothetical protein
MELLLLYGILKSKRWHSKVCVVCQVTDFWNIVLQLFDLNVSIQCSHIFLVHVLQFCMFFKMKYNLFNIEFYRDLNYWLKNSYILIEVSKMQNNYSLWSEDWPLFRSEGGITRSSKNEPTSYAGIIVMSVSVSYSTNVRKFLVLLG